MIQLVNRAWYVTKNGTRVQLLAYTGAADEDGDVGVISSKDCVSVVQEGGECRDNPELSLVERVIPTESAPLRKKPLRITFTDPS